tara:strand:- start:532 stop:771 length:240 start_codon:yes stop_codon:yes gene_type:complete
MDTNTTTQIANELFIETTKLNIQKQITADLKFKLLNLHKMNYCMSAGIGFTLCSCGKIVVKSNIKHHTKSKFHISKTTE